MVDVGFEGVPVYRSVEHAGRNHAARCEAGDEVRRLPRRAGRPTRRRSPRRHRPWVRAILVDAQVSSMNMSVRDQIELLFDHAWRRFNTSGRSCSLACAVFWRVIADGRRRGGSFRSRQQRLSAQARCATPHRDVRFRLEDGEDRIFVSINPPGFAVAAQRLRTRLALLTCKGSRPADTGSADPETLADLTVTETGATARDDGRKVIDSGADMPAGLLPADSFYHHNADRGIAS